ncbi:MAG: Gfo/Idh/MocA family protein [Spirochaetia bacterium]
MKTINFGIIGLGLMGREFASAVMRWKHLPDMDVQPRITAICSLPLPPETEAWYREGLGTITQATEDYKELLKNPDVDAVYCAVPHNLHQEIYTAIIRSGKHLFGEKPFGIDKAANEAILAEAEKYPDVFVRCVSQFPFMPGSQRICRLIEEDFFGKIIEVEADFLHSSDMNLEKPINWKRMIDVNGEYGCMGDLGMHTLTIPFRAGWIPRNVRAFLSNLVPRRPDGKGGTAACETWDNATLLCDTETRDGHRFPMTVKTFRIAPGEMNTWSITVKGLKGAARFTTKQVNHIEILEYTGGEQVWQHIDLGQDTAFATITGGIFEFGFSDAVLQMMAGYCYELAHGKPLSKFTGCVTPEETHLSHRLFTAALESQKNTSTAEV